MGVSRARYAFQNVALITAGDATAILLSPTDGAAGGEYVFDADFTGASSGLVLTAAGANGDTRRVVATLATSGLSAVVKIGQGSRLFVRADGSDATAVSVSLSQVQ